MAPIDWVARYIKLGFIVHPCCPVDHGCQSPGKIPYDAVGGHHMSDWQSHVQFTLSQWEYFFECSPNINLGVLTGAPSGLLFIDIDSEEAEHEFRKQLESEPGRPRSYWSYRTGAGARYIFRGFKEEPNFPTFIYNTPGGLRYEIQGDGRQSVLPPSSHPRGGRYVWTPGHTPSSSGIDRPPAFLRATTGGCGTVITTADTTDWERTLTDGAAEGTRNEFLTRVAGFLINGGPKPEAVVRLLLSAYNKVHVKPPLPQSELDSIIYSITKAENSMEKKILELMAEYGMTRYEAIELAENMDTTDAEEAAV